MNASVAYLHNRSNMVLENLTITPRKVYISYGGLLLLSCVLCIFCKLSDE